MANGIEVIIGMLVFLAMPVVLGVVWVLRQHQRKRRFELELKRGNKIYSEWRRTGVGNPPE
jgi:hypothetical protein